MANATGSENQDGGTTAEPKYLTAEEATTLIGTVVNSAITAHSKRNAKGAAEEMRKLLAEEIAKAIPAKTDDSADPPAGAKKPDQEAVAMRRKMEELEGRLKAADERAVAAEKRGREERARADLTSQLGPVREELKPVLSEYLFHRVSFDDEGAPLLKVGEDALPLKDGVSAFLKSKEAAVFLPPPGGGGTATAGKSGKVPTTPAARGADGLPRYDKEAVTDEEKVQRAIEREQAWLASKSQQ